MATSNLTPERGSTATTRGNTTEDSFPKIFEGDWLPGVDIIDLERKLRTQRYNQKAELHVPGKFTSNKKHLNTGKTFTIQYLTHSTHSPQLDLIWDGTTATFIGHPKLASLHMSPRDGFGHAAWARTATWKAVDWGLRQLEIRSCRSCSRGVHQCEDRCCRLSRSEYVNVGDKLAEFSQLTCKKGMSLQEGEKTCHGERCREVERVLPGSYIWFGVAKLEGEADPVDEQTFLEKWTRFDIYGTKSFVIDIRTLLCIYKAQIAKGKDVVLRCGGTLLYHREVCYVVIVTYTGDNDHDGLPPVTSIGDNSHCNWKKLLDDVGTFTESGYPSFLPHHVQDGSHLYRDHVVFAVSLPRRAALQLDRESLCGKCPLPTNHSGLCHRFKPFPQYAAELCKEEELLYHMHHHGVQVSPLTSTKLRDNLMQFAAGHRNRFRALEICAKELQASSVLELRDIMAMVKEDRRQDRVVSDHVAEEQLLKALKMLLQRVKEEEIAQVQYLLDPIEHLSPIRGQAEEAVLAVLREKLVTITSAQASGLIRAFRCSTEAFKVVCRCIQDFGEIDKVLEVVADRRECRVIARQELLHRLAPAISHMRELTTATICLSTGETDDHFEEMKRTAKKECKALVNAMSQDKVILQPSSSEASERSPVLLHQPSGMVDSGYDLPFVKTEGLAFSSTNDAPLDTDISDSEEVEFDGHSSPLLGSKRKHTLSDSDCSSDMEKHEGNMVACDSSLTGVQHDVSDRGNDSDSSGATTVDDVDD